MNGADRVPYSLVRLTVCVLSSIRYNLRRCERGQVLWSGDRMPMPKKPRNACVNCGKEAERWNVKYCSNRCQVDFQYKQYIERWQAGQESGLIATEVVSSHIRRYLGLKYGEQCGECGWNRKSLFTGHVPLTIHHRDGDWRNNREDNLILLCPNCHSLTENFMNLNRGKGRTYRRKYEPRKTGN